MARLKGFTVALAVVAAVALHAMPAAAAEPVSSPPEMTPIPQTPMPQTGVTIRLPFGALITIPVEPTSPMQGGGNQDHLVGEDLC